METPNKGFKYEMEESMMEKEDDDIKNNITDTPKNQKKKNCLKEENLSEKLLQFMIRLTKRNLRVFTNQIFLKKNHLKRK